MHTFVCYEHFDVHRYVRQVLFGSADSFLGLVVSADTDMLINGVSKWVSVKNWWMGEATFIDVTAEGLAAHVPQLDENGDDKHPLLTDALPEVRCHRVCHLGGCYRMRLHRRG